jgi:hypothetical protein
MVGVLFLVRHPGEYLNTALCHPELFLRRILFSPSSSQRLNNRHPREGWDPVSCFEIFLAFIITEISVAVGGCTHGRSTFSREKWTLPFFIIVFHEFGV